MSSNDASTRAPLTRFTLGMLALSLFTLGCDPVEPVTDDELLAEDDEEELDALAAMPDDEEDDEDLEVEDYEPEQDDAADAPWPAPADGDAGFELTAAADATASVWTNFWFSEETPPSTCGANHLVTDVACEGWYCDNMQLGCSGPYTLGSTWWTPWFSEEGTGFQICGGNGYVSGMACSGWWCDNIALQCSATNKNPALWECAWSGWYSEENPGNLTSLPMFNAPKGRAIKGVQCSGSYCDNKRYYHCAI